MSVVMRKFIPLLAVCALFALPAVSLAFPSLAGNQKDGTLSIKNGDGMVYVNARGAIIGQVDKSVGKKGGIVLTDFKEDDGSGATFTGCEKETETETESGEGTITVCRGTKIRFKLIGGTFRIRIRNGKGIDLSAVGRSKPDQVWLDGDGDEADSDGDDGKFSFNGEPHESLPDKLRKTYQLGSS